MKNFDVVRFIADHAGMNVAEALEVAYKQGRSDVVYQAVYEQVRSDATQNWISCDEWLPEENNLTRDSIRCSDWCLATLVSRETGYREVDIVRTEDGRWKMKHSHFDGDFPSNDIPYYKDVAAWMPMPEIYQEGEDNADTNSNHGRLPSSR